MKRSIILFICLLTSIQLPSQDITGDWFGSLDIQGFRLPLVFHIDQTDDEYSATLDSPDQGAFGIPVSSITFENLLLKIGIQALGATYEGNWVDGGIEGTFHQAGQSFPLTLSREEEEKPVLNRPQEPTPPYPYRSEEVVFPNPEFDISLAGTLTLPEGDGKHPVVVLISGSGPQNRNEELMGHKPFLVISDFLTRNGIGVLRYDDRGVGSSTGVYSTATSEDLATDVESAITYLKSRPDIDTDRIGLVGHSEGGLIAPMVAVDNEEIAFIVLLAGPGIRGDSILLLQQALIARAGGAPDSDVESMTEINSAIFGLVQEVPDTGQLKQEITNYLEQSIQDGRMSDIPEGMDQSNYISTAISNIVNPWMLYFLTYDPAPTLEKVKCPVLAVNGEKDLQVTPKENLHAIASALKKGGNPNVTTKELPGLNHLFQESETGSPGEYSSIEQTFSEDALTIILEWVNEQIK